MKIIPSLEDVKKYYMDYKASPSKGVIDESNIEKALKEINKSHGWKYADWDELSRKENLTDSELEKYETYVNWYVFLSMHPDREFNDIYKKKFKQHLILRNLNLIPYNGTRATKPEEYKASSIKEDRKRAEHIRELKAKREARKKIREGE